MSEQLDQMYQQGKLGERGRNGEFYSAVYLDSQTLGALDAIGGGSSRSETAREVVTRYTAMATALLPDLTPEEWLVVLHATAGPVRSYAGPRAALLGYFYDEDEEPGPIVLALVRKLSRLGDAEAAAVLHFNDRYWAGDKAARAIVHPVPTGLPEVVGTLVTNCGYDALIITDMGGSRLHTINSPEAFRAALMVGTEQDLGRWDGRLMNEAFDPQHAGNVLAVNDGTKLTVVDEEKLAARQAFWRDW
ncbi:hypothetical protein [Muricoccus nepalensis]|nr:hypothetical protein [Roseomonas nepalensis]